MRALDEIHLAYPFLGSRKLVSELVKRGLLVNRKRVQRLMGVMGIEAIYPKPRTSKPGAGAGHKVYPYRLNGVEITRANQVWAADVTYIPMAAGFAYLVAIMDVLSRPGGRAPPHPGVETVQHRRQSLLYRRAAPRRWRPTGSRRSSTPIRAAPSPARRSPACSRRAASPSAWTAPTKGRWAGGSTTCSSNASGAA